jgi:hypothetical protein
VYDKPKHEKSLFIRFVSAMLFLAPKDHLREMERLWTDEIIVERVWKSVMSKLVQDWERVILWVRVQLRNVIGSPVSRDYYVQSTVMLTANVGFLAIPDVIPPSSFSETDTTDMSQAVEFSYLEVPPITSSLSILISIGSIMIGLLLVHHNRTKQNEDPASAVSGQSHLMCEPR